MIKRMTGLKENLFIKEILKIKIIFFILFFIFSCQPVEVLDEVIFEYNQLPKISINAKEKLMKDLIEQSNRDEKDLDMKGLEALVKLAINQSKKEGE